MTQLHTIDHGLGIVRPTNDVDIVLHIASTVDVVASASHENQVDVLIADHPAPRVIEKLRGYEMIRIEGGTQALRRTVNARLEIVPGTVATISVPHPFGALILKAAAYSTDSRDRERHLFDAAALLACIDDPFSERAEFTGSDHRRIATLVAQLDVAHPAWRALPEDHRTQAQLTLDLLVRSEPDSTEGGFGVRT